jgi:tetratricopeptide (TPR) repeat protein
MAVVSSGQGEYWAQPRVAVGKDRRIMSIFSREAAERRHAGYQEREAARKAKYQERAERTNAQAEARQSAKAERKATAAAAAVSASQLKRVWLPGRMEVQVAGESFHQDAIHAVEEHSSPGSPLVADLRPDPGNPHDSNAVAVYVNGEHVGFLPRDMAPRMQPAIAAFSHANGGRLVSCPAEIRWHDVGPQVVLRLDPRPLGLSPEAVETVPDMAATTMRLLARLDEPSPPLTGSDTQARSALARVEGEREEIEVNYDRSPRDWPRVEDALHSLADRLAIADDPSASDAWLSVARATRYQRGRRDDTLAALIEALYWGRGNEHAWSELVEYVSAAPHVPMLLALFERVPFENRTDVLTQLLRISEGRDRLGRLHLAAGERLRQELLDVAESRGDMATVAALTGYAGLAAEKASDLDAAVRYWRRAIAAGSTDQRVADRFSVWLVNRHEYQEAAQVLRQALVAHPDSAEVAERMRRRLARCDRNLAEYHGRTLP